MKLSAVCFFGNRSMAKGVSEDRLAHLLVCLGPQGLLASSDG